MIYDIRKKRTLWKHYCSTKEYQSYLVYKQVRNFTKSVIRKAKRDFEKKLAANTKKNPEACCKWEEKP